MTENDPTADVIAPHLRLPRRFPQPWPSFVRCFLIRNLHNPNVPRIDANKALRASTLTSKSVRDASMTHVVARRRTVWRSNRKYVHCHTKSEARVRHEDVRGLRTNGMTRINCLQMLSAQKQRLASVMLTSKSVGDASMTPVVARRRTV